MSPSISSSQQVGGQLSLHVPATVDVECSCFCLKKKSKPTTPVVVHQNSLVPVRNARTEQTTEAVQRVYDEVIRRCHPDLSRATSILENAGLSILEQPQFLTLAHIEAIQEQLGD